LPDSQGDLPRSLPPPELSCFTDESGAASTKARLRSDKAKIGDSSAIPLRSEREKVLCS
jgi:hypothetical protein